jgi:hypothetical protein
LNCDSLFGRDTCDPYARASWDAAMLRFYNVATIISVVHGSSRSRLPEK